MNAPKIKKNLEDKSLTIALAGNPNVGKSTIFNLLTGSKQKIANYPGVTVEKKYGQYIHQDTANTHIIDLPGIYSLNPQSEDEVIAKACILGKVEGTTIPDAVIVVAEACHLDRGLLLFKQIQAIHPQVILALNMMDELNGKSYSIDIEKLSELIKAPIIPMIAKKGKGLEELKKAINDFSPVESFKNKDELEYNHEKIESQQLFKDIDALVKQVVSKKQITRSEITEKLDHIFLHKFFGPLFFLLIIYLLFQSLFTWSDPLIGFIEDGIGFLSNGISHYLADGWLKSFLTDGIIAGVGSVVVFVPQIAITFLLVGILEMTGYLSRGAFLIDRFMRFVGLEGRAFIPLLSSFACAIPGIAATRTIPNSRQRLITILIAPLMTCSARLPVYTLLIASFVPNESIYGLSLPALTLFSLFILGIIAALVVAFIFDKFLPNKKNSTFFIELPRYRLPTLKNLSYYVWFRTKSFLISAGTIIFVFSVILWALAYFPRNEQIIKKYDNQISLLQKSSNESETIQKQISALEHKQAGELIRNSFMGKVGQFIEPIIQPMGFDWKMGIGILSAFAAREVFVSTMGIVYNLGETDEESAGLRSLLQNAKTPEGNPLYTLRTALALLVFFALACQCTSTLAIIKRETNSMKWPIIVFTYMTLLAYVLAICTYQGLGLLNIK